MGLISELGYLALGSRVRRLSDIMMREVKQIYEKSGIDFDPRWFPVFFILSKRTPKTITELADEVGLSHPAVIQIVKELEKADWIVSEKSNTDARKRNVKISEKGLTTLPRLQTLWHAFITTNEAMLDQLNSPLLSEIKAVEEFYNKNEYQNLFLNNMQNIIDQKVEIIDYSPELLPYFVNLNKDWISKYFVMEPNDYKQLEEAEANIINQEGRIYFAKYGDAIIGTVALLKVSETDYELAKMAVDTKYQGLGAGRLLGEHVIAEAKKIGAKYLFLESNTKLTPALTLYKKLGFIEVPIDNPHYSRANFKAEIHF